MRARLHADGPEAGVIAVLTAVIVAFALIPVAALALTSYTRAAVSAEMTRSADSGALAGAAALALVNLAAVPVPTPPSPLPPSPIIVPTNAAVVGPTGTACRAALAAVAADADLAATYATPPTCNAVFAPPPAFGSCISQLLAALPTTLPPLPTVPGLPLPTALPSVSSIIISLLPALTDNGVVVTLRYQVTGPLDAVFPGQAARTIETTSTARRRFKRLLPPASALAPTVPLLTPVQQELVDQLQAAIEEIRDLVNGTVAPIAGPDLPDACVVAVNDALDDLSDGLKIAPSGTGQVGCLLGLLPGVDPFTVLTPAVACTGDVFRAQLAPNPP